MLDGYNDSNWGRAWELIAVLRKALLLGIPTGFVALFKDARSQVCLVLLLLTASLALHIVVQPFKQPVMNALDFLSYVATIAVALSVSTRVSAAMSRGYGVNAWEQLFFDVTALLMCVPFLVFWVFLAADSVLYDGYMVVAARIAVAKLITAVYNCTGKLARECYELARECYMCCCSVCRWCCVCCWCCVRCVCRWCCVCRYGKEAGNALVAQNPLRGAHAGDRAPTNPMVGAEEHAGAGLPLPLPPQQQNRLVEQAEPRSNFPPGTRRV